MIKKILLAVMLLLPSVVTAESWKLHPQFTQAGITNSIDAADCVYMLVNNTLNRFDKASTEITTLKSAGGLSEDIGIKQIYYNYDKQYLLIVYLNSNMDVVKSDNSVVNIPALLNMKLQGVTKTVNDVNFSNNAIYISTGFGYLVLDDTTLETVDYRNYGMSFHSLTRVGSSLVAAVGNNLYRCPTLKPGKFTDFTPVSLLGNRTETAADATVTTSTAKLYNINDSTRFFMFSVSDSSYMKRCEIVNGDEGAVINQTLLAKYANSNKLLNIQNSKTGFMWNFVLTDKTYYSTDANGATYKSANGALNAIYSCSPHADGTLWGLGSTGLFKNNASSKLYKPNAISLATPYWASYNPHNGKTYVTCSAATTVIPKVNSTGFMTYDGQTWKSEGYTWTSAVKAQNTNHAGWRPVFDPKEENTYYLGTWFCGGVKVTNDTVVAVYDENNSTIVKAGNYYSCVQGYGLDSQGNLWFVQSDDVSKGDLSKNPVLKAANVLPADKLKLNNNVTADDWYSYALPGTVGITSSKFSSFAIGRGDVKVYTPGNGGSVSNYLICWRGELDAEPETKQFKKVNDQFGTSISCGLNPVLAADSTGLVWQGGSGVFYFDPTTAFGDVLEVTRPLTASGEFALNGITVNHIEVDYLDRKWVSTRSDGIYLLSPDGTEILKHFDNTNSELPSNLVYSTCAMGSTGHVMIMTDNGVIEYSEQDEEMAVATEIEVYPTIVMPDFTGLVTISGVSAGTGISICDYDGNVVTEFTADGNVATWNCCDAATGRSLPTGVYRIFITAAGEETPAEPQATVRVIK